MAKKRPDTKGKGNKGKPGRKTRGMRSESKLKSFGQQQDYYNPFKHLESQGEIGSAGANRFSRGEVTLDFETDIANLKSLILIPEIYMLINESVINKWNGDQQDNYADLIAYGAQLICELKHQLTQVDYIPSLTRGDATAGLTFTRSTMNGLLASLHEIRLPIESYVIAKQFCKVMQLKGAEFQAGYPAEFFYPWKPFKTAAEIETLLGTIEGLYDAVVYATQANQRLLPLTPAYVRAIDEVSMNSHFGWMVANLLPVADDAAISYIEVDETSDIYWHQLFGIPEIIVYSALWRSISAADSPKILTLSVQAANRISISHAALGDTALVTDADSITRWDWIYACSVRRSAAQTGIFKRDNNEPYISLKENVTVGPDTWNRYCSTSLAIKSKAKNPMIESVSQPLIMDYVGSRRRASAPGGSGKDGKSDYSQMDYGSGDYTFRQAWESMMEKRYGKKEAS